MAEKAQRFCHCRCHDGDKIFEFVACCMQKDAPRAELRPLPIPPPIGEFKSITMPVIKSKTKPPNIMKALSEGRAMMAPTGTRDADGNIRIDSIDIVQVTPKHPGE